MTLAWLHQIPDLIPPGDQTPYQLFVYGTQMFLLARNADHQEYAFTWGHLCSPRSLLEIPDGFGFSRSTGNPIEDAEAQEVINKGLPPSGKPSGAWEKTIGRLLTFQSPSWRIPPVDRLIRFGYPEDAVDLTLLPVMRGGGQATWAWCHVKRGVR